MASWTEKQQNFLNNATHRWNIKCGATRSGKTYLDYFVIPKRIRRVAGLDGLVVLLGNTKGTLQRNVIEPMQKIWGTQLVSNIKSDNTAMLFGEKCFCLGADNIKHVNRIRGASFKYCYGDEIVTWNKEVFEMLKSRLDKPYSKFDGTCNPDSPNHWLKQFIDDNTADIYYQQYTIYDNPFLDDEVKNNLIKEHTGVFYRRNILGEWALADGLVYDYNPEINEIDAELDKENRQLIFADGQIQKLTGEWIMACDYGITNPFVCQLWNVSYHNAICVAEYNYSSKANNNRRKTDVEHYECIKELANCVPISMILIDPSASSMYELIRKDGLFPVRGANNDVLGGIGNMSSYLSQGFLKYNKRLCQGTIKEFGLYSWDSDSGKDQVIKENDHGMDASRYLCETMLRRLW